MATEKKEKVAKKTKEVIHLSKDKQRRLKTYSKITYVLARIAKVCLIIGVVGLAIAMTLTPVLVKNIKVKDNTLEIFGNKLEYVENNGKIDLSIKGTSIGTLTSEEKISFDYIIKEIEKTNVFKTFAFVELTIILGIASMLVLYFILKHLDELFTNIYNLDTPFNENNLNHIKRIAYLALILLIINFVSDLFSGVFISNGATKVDLISVITVMIVYIISLIFEYACLLQKESKTTIYYE